MFLISLPETIIEVKINNNHIIGYYGKTSHCVTLEPYLLGYTEHAKAHHIKLPKQAEKIPRYLTKNLDVVTCTGQPYAEYVFEQFLQG